MCWCAVKQSINQSIFLVVSHSFTHLVLFFIHALLQLLVAKQYFFPVNLANFYEHLILLSYPLNCLQSQSNFLTLIIYNVNRSLQFTTKSRQYMSFSQFLEDSDSHVWTSHEFLITGDFDFHVDDLTESNCLVMAFRRPIYTFQLTGYATESNEKKYICCFMQANHAINNIYKLISFLN